ncbi:MAG: Arginine repressor, partial [Planctomycetota bacterium]
RLQDGTPEPSGDALDALARRLLAGVEQAGNLVVLHTPPGQASALALQLDRSSMRGVVGTIAGDDCVFVATRTASNAKELVRRLTVAASPARRKATA